MPAAVVAEEVFLDSKPLGLADELAPVGEPFCALVSSEDEVRPGQIVYFGVDLEIGDVGEVKARVLSCEPRAGGCEVTLEVLALDARYPGPLRRALVGGAPAVPAAGNGGVTWALGLKQTNGTFATLVNCPAGLLTAAQLRTIAELAEKGAGLAKLTHAQRVVLLLKPGQLDTVRDDLAAAGLRVGVLHHGIRNIRGCCGALCRWAQETDGLGLALALDQALFGRPMKFDVKIAVSDCARNCMEAYCVDIGLIGDRGTYGVYVGGAASAHQLRAVRVAQGVAPVDAIPLVERILGWYEANALDGERLHKTLERLGRPEAEARAGGSFHEAARAFEGVELGDDVARTLSRKLARSWGARRLQEGLGLVP